MRLGVKEFFFETVEALTDGAVDNVAADADAQTAEEFRRDLEFRGQILAIPGLEVGGELLGHVLVQFHGALDDGVVPGDLHAHEALEFLEDAQRIAGLGAGHFLGDGCDPLGVETTILEAGAEKLLRELA